MTDAPSFDLTLIWAGLIALAVLSYVILDGFDLGVGILFAVEREPEDRDVMVNSIAPTWDGNETWLVFGGGGLFAVFPLAYGIIMTAMYPTIIAMLLALVFRGVAFEFRFRAATRKGKRAWDLAFCLGSTLAAFAQGLTLGGLLQGMKVVDRVYAGGWWDWLNGFTILCGVAVVLGYALQGSTWLIWRTEGSLRARAQQLARILGPILLLLVIVVSLWTPSLDPHYMQRWFGWPGVVLTSPVPILVALVAWRFWRGLVHDGHVGPFLCTQALFVLCFIGLGISVYPMIVPPSITIFEAAAPRSSQLFLLVGAVVLIPTIMTYTAFAYWIFRGKVKHGIGYH